MALAASCDVVIPWRTDDGHRQKIFDWIKCRWESHYPDFGVIEGDAGGANFSRSKTRNVLVEQSRADIVILADADTAPVGAGLIESYIDVIENDCWHVAYPEGHYYNLTREFTQTVLQNPPEAVLLAQRDQIEHQLTSWAGMLVMRRETFLRYGGYDERFIGWGHEDVAFRLKYDNEFSKHRRPSNGAVYHLWHPREDATFDTESELVNRKLFEREYARKYNWRDERLQRRR